MEKKLGMLQPFEVLRGPRGPRISILGLMSTGGQIPTGRLHWITLRAFHRILPLEAWTATLVKLQFCANETV